MKSSENKENNSFILLMNDSPSQSPLTASFSSKTSQEDGDKNDNDGKKKKKNRRIFIADTPSPFLNRRKKNLEIANKITLFDLTNQQKNNKKISISNINEKGQRQTIDLHLSDIIIPDSSNFNSQIRVIPNTPTAFQQQKTTQIKKVNLINYPINC
jgi:hypothetical protein